MILWVQSPLPPTTPLTNTTYISHPHGARPSALLTIAISLSEYTFTIRLKGRHEPRIICSIHVEIPFIVVDVDCGHVAHGGQMGTRTTKNESTG